MRKYLTPALAGLVILGSATLAIAQTTEPSNTMPPPDSSTSPSSASSPHQRDTTSNPSSESTTTNGTDPSAASTPHQRQATASGSGSHSKMMKECIAKQRAQDSSMSKEQAKKTCKEQIKANPDQG